MLTEPLTLEHVKPRLLGHWGTTPGLNLIYAHLNRVIVERGLDAMYVIGPDHGRPGLVANAYSREAGDADILSHDPRGLQESW